MKKINKITEDSNPKSKNIDKKNINEILHIINDEDKVVADAVSDAFSDISGFIDKVIKSLNERSCFKFNLPNKNKIFFAKSIFLI